MLAASTASPMNVIGLSKDVRVIRGRYSGIFEGLNGFRKPAGANSQANACASTDCGKHLSALVEQR